MIKRIHHIGIAVYNLEDAVERYTKLGFTVDKVEELPEYGAKMAFIPCGESLIELIEPTTPQSSRFLETHGEGLHHICYEVDDIDEAFEAISPKLTVRNTSPCAGAGNTRVFFVEPESLCNVETEFAQMPTDEV